MRRRPRRGPDGFGLLQLAIWMLVLGVALAITLRLLPSDSDENRLEDTIATLGDTEDALLGYLVRSGGLPEPDTDGDGSGDPGADTGAVPFREMGLPAPVVDEASVPLRYTPYRNPAADADLAGGVNLYVPALPDGTSRGCPANPASPVNLLDFCTALANAKAAAASVDYVNTQIAGVGTVNVAYALLSGGLEDADGNAADRSLDGLNDDGNVTYEDPARGREKAYDDLVRTTPFAQLERELSCEALVCSVDLLTSVAVTAEEIAVDASDRLDAAEWQLVMANINVFFSFLTLADIGVGAIGIGLDIAKAIPLCNVPPNVTCCPALVALGIGLTVYTVTALVQTAKIVATIIERDKTEALRDKIRDVVLPEANEHLCAALAEASGADARGGL